VCMYGGIQTLADSVSGVSIWHWFALSVIAGGTKVHATPIIWAVRCSSRLPGRRYEKRGIPGGYAARDPCV